MASELYPRSYALTVATLFLIESRELALAIYISPSAEATAHMRLSEDSTVTASAGVEKENKHHNIQQRGNSF